MSIYYRDIIIIVCVISLYKIYIILKNKIINLEKKVSTFINLEQKLSILEQNTVDMYIQNTIDEYFQIIINKNMIDKNIIDKKIINTNQQTFNINKDNFTVVKLTETLIMGLSIIIEDKNINYNNIEKILKLRSEQNADTIYTYKLTRNDLKKLVIASIN